MLVRYKDIWMNRNTSGTSQDWTAHYLQWWHNWTNSFKSMALQVLLDTLYGTHSGTKNHHCSGTPSVWAPTPKSQNSHKKHYPSVILPYYLRMAQIHTVHNTSV